MDPGIVHITGVAGYNAAQIGELYRHGLTSAETLLRLSDALIITLQDSVKRTGLEYIQDPAIGNVLPPIRQVRMALPIAAQANLPAARDWCRGRIVTGRALVPLDFTPPILDRWIPHRTGMLAMVANAPTDATSPLLPSVNVFPDYREQLHDHLTRVPSSDGIKCMSYLMKILDEPTQAQLAVVYGTPLLELQALSVMRGPYYEQDNVLQYACGRFLWTLSTQL
jgi:hypothetical protein